MKNVYYEDKTISLMIYKSNIKYIDKDYMESTIKQFFLDGIIKGWAMCDSMSCKVLKLWMQRD